MKRSSSLRALSLCTLAALAAHPALSAENDQTAKRVVVQAPPVPSGVLSAKAPPNPIYDLEALGEAQIEAGQRVAFDSKRRLLVNFGTNACGEPCVAFNKAIFDKKFYLALIKQFVPVFVEVTPGTRNEKLLEKYGIDASKGLPAVIIFDPVRTEVAAAKRGEVAAVAKKGPEAVQEWILGQFQKDE